MLLIFYHIFILLQVSYVPWLVKITAEPAICRKKVMAACRNNTQPNPFMFFFQPHHQVTDVPTQMLLAQ